MATGIPSKNYKSSNEPRTKSVVFSATDFGKHLSNGNTNSVDPFKKINLKTSTTQTKFSNRLYYGDNLLALKLLLKDPTVKGKVKLVYIDPPYATKSVFESRSQNHAYEDLLSGSPYIEFMRTRLMLLRELLSTDGSIYVHLDENMAFEVKLLMDQIFGKNNFRNWITRKKCNPKNYTRKTYGNVSDFIMFYSKSDVYTWNRSVETWGEDRLLAEYSYIDEKTGRRFKKVPIHAPGVRNGETGKPWRGMLPPPGKHWQYTPTKLDAMDAKGEIFWSSNNNPRRKIFMDESKGVPVQDIWLDFKDAHNQNINVTGYPTEKNPELLKRIIQASSDSGDIVLDCFAGSGTTLKVASELERKWIGVDNSPEAIKAILERFANGSKRMGDFVSKKTTSESKQGALPLSVKVNTEPKVPGHKIIDDFTLYSESEREKDLDFIAKQWDGWMNKGRN